MKKYIACLAVLFFATQVTAQDKFSLGIKVGQNFSSVNQVAVDHNTASYHAGVNMHIGITDKIGIAPEVILSQTKLENTPSVLNLLTNSLSQPETYHLNYLSIPILLDAKLFKKLSVQAGPQYSILLDQKKDGIGNASMAFKNGEFAFVGGGKFDLGGFYLYGRYVVGLNSINELQNQNQWKTTQWQLGIGMSLLNF
jgi:hypothetical protein